MELGVPQLCVGVDASPFCVRARKALPKYRSPGRLKGRRHEASSRTGPAPAVAFPCSARLRMQRAGGTAAGLRPPSPVGVTANPGGDACRSGAASSRRPALFQPGASRASLVGWLLGPDCHPERDTGMADGCIALLVPARGLLGDGSSNAQWVFEEREGWGKPVWSRFWVLPRAL